ncbi:MAG: hypothetical protein WKF60_11215, partial [Ilumatobacter sp.]
MSSDGTGPHEAGEPPTNSAVDERDDRDVLSTTGREARRGSFGPGGGAGMPTERSKDFGTSVRRLGEILGSERPLLFVVFGLTVASVLLV